MDEHILWPLISGVLTSLTAALVGQYVLQKREPNGKPPDMLLYPLRAASLLIGLLVFAVWRWGKPTPSSVPDANAFQLQSVQTRPNTARVGDHVKVTVQLDRAAPSHGARIVLTSSDPAILTVDGVAVVPEGSPVATAYSEVVGQPNYLSPVTIFASYQGNTVQTDLKVLGRFGEKSAPDAGPPGKVSPATRPKTAADVSKSAADVRKNPPAEENAPPAKASPSLNPELLSRLEEAQGQLAAEEGYWEGVKQHMPPGTSLRPEIVSQIAAAKSAVQRCAKAREAVEASALSSCIDALNDHLTQLKIQH